MHINMLIASQAINTDEEVNVTLAENKTIRYNFLIPVIGVTVKVCITGGHIRAYGSVSIPNPNSAFNDFFIELDYENDNDTCGHAYVEPCATSSSPPRSRRQTSQSHTNNQIVYVSIEARDKDSSFAVDTITGDVYRDVNNGSTPESKSQLTEYRYVC